MKAKKSIRFLSMALSVLFLISMLVVSVVPASAADDAGVTGPGPEVQYMYKWERGTEGGAGSVGFQFEFAANQAQAITWQEGDTYRLSFYYHADEGSLFPMSLSDPNTPIDFTLRLLPNWGADGSNWKYMRLGQGATVKAVSSDWYYVEYEWTANGTYNGYLSSGLAVSCGEKPEKGETVYFADLQFRKVTNGVVGENILVDMSTKSDLSKWYLYNRWGFGTGINTFTYGGNTLTVEPYDEALFKRPVTYYTVNVVNGSVDGETDQFAAGEEVTVKADPAPEGQEFDSWTAEGVSLDKPGDETVTFTMPANDVTLTAGYKDAENTGDTDNPGGNPGDNTGDGDETDGGPGKDVEYMYKWERDTGNHTGSVGFQFQFADTEDKALVMHEGDTYRLSLYYHADEGSALHQGLGGDSPLSFALRLLPYWGADGKEWKYIGLPDRAVLQPADPDWYYLEYYWTSYDEIEGLICSGITIHMGFALEEEETIYFADVQFCKVDEDGNVGENILVDMSTKNDLSKWYLFETWDFGVGKPSSTYGGGTLSVEPYDESLFKRPDVYYTVTVENGSVVGDTNKFKPGSEVTVKADPAPEGEVFDFWYAEGVSLDKPGDETVTFYMPGCDVSLSAIYMEDEDGDNTGNGSGTGDSNTGTGDSNTGTGDSNTGNGGTGDGTDAPETGETGLISLFVLAGGAALVTALVSFKKKEKC